VFQFWEATLPAGRIELIDREHANTTLGASGTAHQPWTAAACGVRESRVDDLN
jgi:hypothetical protein